MTDCDLSFDALFSTTLKRLPQSVSLSCVRDDGERRSLPKVFDLMESVAESFANDGRDALIGQLLYTVYWALHKLSFQIVSVEMDALCKEPIKEDFERRLKDEYKTYARPGNEHNKEMIDLYFRENGVSRESKP